MLINTAANSSMLICRMPVGRGAYLGGSESITGQPIALREDDDMRHLKGGDVHQPPSPSYDASVQLTMWGERGTSRPMGRLQSSAASELTRS